MQLMLDEVETTRCRQFAQPEFRFKVDRSSVLAVDVDWLVTTLEKWVADGERFQNGETIQVGWGLLKVRSNSDGTASLLEPDYTSMPIEWLDTLTQTLIDLRTQKDVCESYFAPEAADFPSLRSSCIVCSGLEDAPRVVMERMAASPPDSGWFIGCGDAAHDYNSPDQLHRASLYDAVLKNHRSKSFLALPPATLLEVDDAVIHLYHRNTRIEPKRGSYIERLGRQ